MLTSLGLISTLGKNPNGRGLRWKLATAEVEVARWSRIGRSAGIGSSIIWILGVVAFVIHNSAAIVTSPLVTHGAAGTNEAKP